MVLILGKKMGSTCVNDGAVWFMTLLLLSIFLYLEVTNSVRNKIKTEADKIILTCIL